MNYEERAKKFERRLKNTNIDYTFHHPSKSVELIVFDKVDSSLFAGLDEEFIEAEPVTHEQFNKSGMKLVFNI